jgi:stonin-1/2
LLKLGSHNFEDMKQFSICIEEALFKLSAHRDRALNYKVEDVQITAIDELFVDQNSQGSVLKQIARVRLFFLAFMCGECLNEFLV